MLNIHIKTIPAKGQRYPTVGDYWVDSEGVMQFRITEMGSPIKEIAVAIHELIEVFLCRIRGIQWEDIDKFDQDFEASREAGDYSEPGDHADAPYGREHRFAENIERQIIHEAGIRWKEYSDEIEML